MFTRKQVSERKFVVACLFSYWAFKLSELNFSQIFLILKAMSLISVNHHINHWYFLSLIRLHKYAEKLAILHDSFISMN